MAPAFPGSIQTEIGSASPSSTGGRGGAWGFLSDVEETPELRWPHSLVVFDRMRRTDGQTGSVLRAVGLPIRRTTWRITGRDVRPEVLGFVEAELGLQLDDRGRRRRLREGISFDEHLRHALLHLPLGNMLFEPVYRIGAPPPGMRGLPPVVAHLRKLGPRMPRTITRYEVERDGGLAAVWQQTTDPSGLGRDVRLPIERLLVYVNEREGADWLGQSILRTSYAHWLIKTHFMRLDAIAGERQSMGLPVVGFSGNGTAKKALAIGKAARGGEEAAIALPEDYTFRLEGISGSVVDLVPRIKFHDESIGRAALAMFLNLGHDDGARSLGESFTDFFTMSLDAVIKYVEEVLTEHVVRDLVALNFGPDEPYPACVAEPVDPSGALTAEAIGGLVHEGVIIPDADLEAHIRRRAGLPPSMASEAMGPQGPIVRIDPAPAPGGPPAAPVAPGPGGPPTPAPPAGVAAACRICGTPLADPASIARGIGPECWGQGHRPAPASSASGRALSDLERRLELAQRRLEAARRFDRAARPVAPR